MINKQILRLKNCTKRKKVNNSQNTDIHYKTNITVKNKNKKNYNKNKNNNKNNNKNKNTRQ